MAKNELQTHDATTAQKPIEDAMRKNKLIKENMNTFMSLIEATDTTGISILQLSGDSAKDFEMKFLVLKKALMDTKYREQAVDEMLTDLLVTAYRDRVALAYIRPTSSNEGNNGVLRSIQKMRQSADNHLINVLRAVRDIKRPPVQVVVKQAQQVNVAEQMNQGEQQVNIANNGHGTNDLDGPS